MIDSGWKTTLAWALSQQLICTIVYIRMHVRIAMYVVGLIAMAVSHPLESLINWHNYFWMFYDIIFGSHFSISTEASKLNSGTCEWINGFWRECGRFFIHLSLMAEKKKKMAEQQLKQNHIPFIRIVAIIHRMHISRLLEVLALGSFHFHLIRSTLLLPLITFGHLLCIHTFYTDISAFHF